jgi:DNA-binding NarL/FixJ family response regulator
MRRRFWARGPRGAALGVCNLHLPVPDCYRTGRSGFEALQCLMKEEFAVVLLDVSMPAGFDAHLVKPLDLRALHPYLAAPAVTIAVAAK